LCHFYTRSVAGGKPLAGWSGVCYDGFSRREEKTNVKDGIHPNYHDVMVTCA